MPMNPSLNVSEQNINKVIELRQFTSAVRPIYEALSGAHSSLLVKIRDHCAPRHIHPVEALVDAVINDDIKYSKSPLDMRYQRTYAVRVGVNELLDVSRTTYREGDGDIRAYHEELQDTYGMKLELKFSSQRQYYLRFSDDQLESKTMPENFINVIHRKNMVECSTLSLVKRNQKIVDSHNECVLMSDETTNALLDSIREHASALFRVCESLAMLDVVAAFAQLVTSSEYVRPEISETLAISAGRHPIKERLQRSKFVPNDIYATSQKRCQIITGCNMSGKSTYIRTVALMAVIAQIGCFVPAAYAAMPIYHQLFARVNVDDSIEANVSTFAAEMREMAYILRNIDKHSIAIIDELGRGTSTRDGLSIAIAVAEALVESCAMIWFATHFTELAKILVERPGVITLHLAVESPDPATLKMLYRIAPGAETTASYGLTLARLVPLPTAVLTHATHVAKTLRENEARQKASSRAVLTQRRRRLVLELREHLLQAQASKLEGDTLTAWLKELQQEFMRRMSKLEEEVAALPAVEVEDSASEVPPSQSSSMLPI